MKALNRDDQVRILREVKFLQNNPYLGKSLRGNWQGIYSLRIGDFRVFYQIKDDNVFLLTVGRRKSIYQRRS
ncbi:MAG: type II toxin-antitoxin system RelE family toxin [Candidatus Freyarchaeota archaeon]